MNITEINKLRFKQLIDYGLNASDLCNYGYENFLLQEYARVPVNCCTACDMFLNETKLGKMLHGTTSEDYFAYLNIMPDESWNEMPVMFVFENPGSCSGDEFIRVNEREIITRTWPYIGWAAKTCPSDFVFEEEISHSRRYGSLICSIILRYKLKNAYVTNLVKCGFSDNKNISSKNTGKKMCETCSKQVLIPEINIISPKIIFTFGRVAYRRISQLGVPNCIVAYLPHPAARISKEMRAEKLNALDKVFPNV